MKTLFKIKYFHLCTLFLLLFIIILLFSKPDKLLSVNEPMLEEWQELSKNILLKKQIVGWLRCKAKAKITGTECSEKFEITTPPYFGKLGIFITLKKGKNVRGCYGAFSHASTDIAAMLSEYLSGALTEDMRYKPLEISELESTEIIVTITSQPYAVADADSIDVLRYGIALACADGITAVYVPAEIKDTRFIQKKIKESECQISAFKAVTIK